MNPLTGALVLSAAAATAGAGEPPVVVSQQGGAERTLSLTVYNVGRALVRDGRRISLPAGEVSLEFRDIAARVMPETVAVSGEGITVIEQNYEYDLLSPQTLLAKYLNRDVTLVVEEPGEGPGQVVLRRVTGRLLSVENGTVWRIGGDIVMNPQFRNLAFPEVPATLRDRPTLVWLLKSASAGARRLEATYLTEGITWKADYVLTLDGEGNRAELVGWITVDNESGAEYANANLQLVAGDVHLAPAPRAGFVEAMMMKTAAAPVEEESFAEYHLYSVARPTTIKERQKKQISFLEKSGIGVVRRYVVEGSAGLFRNRVGVQRHDVRVEIDLANRAANQLGVPLPAGTLRMYQKDRRGTAQFVGEDAIRHTPVDETVTVTMGNAFDLVAERRQTDYRRFDSTSESAFEVTLRNHKEAAVVVVVRERIGGDWEMLSHSHPFTKEAAFGVSFQVPVEARGSATLKYRVRVR